MSGREIRSGAAVERGWRVQSQQQCSWATLAQWGTHRARSSPESVGIECLGCSPTLQPPRSGLLASLTSSSGQMVRFVRSIIAARMNILSLFLVPLFWNKQSHRVTDRFRRCVLSYLHNTWLLCCKVSVGSGPPSLPYTLRSVLLRVKQQSAVYCCIPILLYTRPPSGRPDGVLMMKLNSNRKREGG